MRGKKQFNIRNVEAHLTSLENSYRTTISSYSNNIIQPSEQQRHNEYINAKFGVSKYTSNLVSGRMFKKI